MAVGRGGKEVVEESNDGARTLVVVGMEAKRKVKVGG